MNSCFICNFQIEILLLLIYDKEQLLISQCFENDFSTKNDFFFHKGSFCLKKFALLFFFYIYFYWYHKNDFYTCKIQEIPKKDEWLPTEIGFK